jgi:acyl-CoA thioester hydrolase
LSGDQLERTGRTTYKSWTTCATRYSDLDPNGHVNNGAINAFFEEARVAFRRESLAEQCGDVLKGFVVAHFSVDYLAALSYPGTAEVGTVVTRIGRSSFGLAQAVFQGDACIAAAEVVAVHTDSATGKSLALPPPLRDALEGYLVSG